MCNLVTRTFGAWPNANSEEGGYMSKAKSLVSLVGLGLVVAAASAQAEQQYTMVPAGNSPILQQKLSSELGESWTVAKQGNSLVADRTDMSTPGPEFQKKITDEVSSLQKKYKELTVRFDGDQMYLSGWTKDCGDLVKKSKNFSKIQGVNHISIEASCSSK